MQEVLVRELPQNNPYYSDSIRMFVLSMSLTLLWYVIRCTKSAYDKALTTLDYNLTLIW